MYRSTSYDPDVPENNWENRVERGRMVDLFTSPVMVDILEHSIAIAAVHHSLDEQPDLHSVRHTALVEWKNGAWLWMVESIAVYSAEEFAALVEAPR